MTWVRALSRGVNAVLMVLFLPGALLEELLHAAAARPWADSISISVDPAAGRARTVVEYRDGTPAWAIRLGHLLPELDAAISGVAVVVWWALGGQVWLPSTTLDWVLLSLFGAQYLAIALPSSADLDHSAERGPR